MPSTEILMRIIRRAEIDPRLSHVCLTLSILNDKEANAREPGIEVDACRKLRPDKLRVSGKKKKVIARSALTEQKPAKA